MNLRTTVASLSIILLLSVLVLLPKSLANNFHQTSFVSHTSSHIDQLQFPSLDGQELVGIQSQVQSFHFLSQFKTGFFLSFSFAENQRHFFQRIGLLYQKEKSIYSTLPIFLFNRVLRL
ncbi:MAG: hypothetical protein CL555_02495 [Algoriphagus sp.]|nr:hypothetical protein [Algoriphagus sp.]